MGESIQPLMDKMAERTREVVFNEIAKERDRQDAKWGSHREMKNSLWFMILLEEIGEAAKADLEGKPYEMCKELTEVAAVIVCWLESRHP